ncbi:SMP-30/gluconolactonase/LRE family protein [Aureimonas sp. AU22]|uniref:SMP-30/gluconolactonase/LRE family protein n=1 Tax=Aureimonas sp. AU22 TaxID=1638162 RepID=UPI0007845ACE|nr:L-dopachrome tautomerase-related protein [Aureimonas sp. AU22]
MTIARRRLLVSALAGAAALPFAGRALAERSPAPAASTGGTATAAREAGEMELAILADAPSTPTGLAISPAGRVFVMMPRFTGREPFTLGEVAPDGSVAAFPDEAANRPDPERPQATLFHVPNGVFDGEGKLWLLDAGLPEGSGPPVPGAAKLVQMDIETREVLRVVPLDPGVEPTSSLNDLRVDIAGGRARAFVTDQGQRGQGAILAVDLDNGRVVRRLGQHASTRSQKGVQKFVEHCPVLRNAGEGKPQPVEGGANGIALGPDGRRLYYAPLMGRRLYGVDADSLLDAAQSDAMVAAGVEDLGEKGMTGGLGADAQDRVYLTLQEQNAVGRRLPDGTVEVLASDPRLVWADTIVITTERWLYVSAAQVNRRPEYNGGEDLQKPPYAILRIRIDAGPA